MVEWWGGWALAGSHAQMGAAVLKGRRQPNSCLPSQQPPARRNAGHPTCVCGRRGNVASPVLLQGGAAAAGAQQAQLILRWRAQGFGAGSVGVADGVADSDSGREQRLQVRQWWC